jgi:hypothetical protein
MAKKQSQSPDHKADGFGHIPQRPARLDTSQRTTHGPFNGSHARAVQRKVNERQGQSPFDADPKKQAPPKPPRGSR